MKAFQTMIFEELTKDEKAVKGKKKFDLDSKLKSPVLSLAEQRQKPKEQTIHSKIDKRFLASQIPEKPYKVVRKK